MKTAWLITWEWIGDHAAVEDKVVAIVNYRRPAAYIKDLMEQLYIEKTSSVSEKVAYAKDMKSNPYPASFGDVGGVQWRSQLYCGHNPHLFARLVSNVRTEVQEGEEKLLWEERPVPAPVLS
jgi:excinuclease UvrABC helicase subunit UvrB